MPDAITLCCPIPCHAGHSAAGTYPHHGDLQQGSGVPQATCAVQRPTSINPVKNCRQQLPISMSSFASHHAQAHTVHLQWPARKCPCPKARVSSKAMPEHTILQKAPWTISSCRMSRVRHNISLHTCRAAMLQYCGMKTYPRHVHIDRRLRARHRRCFDNHIDAALPGRADLHVGVDLPRRRGRRAGRAGRAAANMNTP